MEDRSEEADEEDEDGEVGKNRIATIDDDSGEGQGLVRNSVSSPQNLADEPRSARKTMSASNMQDYREDVY